MFLHKKQFVNESIDSTPIKSLENSDSLRRIIYIYDHPGNQPAVINTIHSESPEMISITLIIHIIDDVSGTVLGC